MWFVLALMSQLAAEEIVITQNGRQVLLRDDGRWVYLSAPNYTEDIGEVLAMVNGTPIGSIAFLRSAKRKSPKNGTSLSLEEREQVLNQLIIDELLYQKAVQNGYLSDPKVKKVAVNALLREEVYNSLKNSDISEAELRAYFQAHQDEFVIPEKVQIYSILIKVTNSRSNSEAKNKAYQLFRELQQDPSQFQEIASRESENPYKRRGGDVGFVPREGKPGLDPIIVKEAFSLQVETLSEPFETKDGWNVIYIPAKREKNIRSFEKMEGSVLRKVKNEKLKANYDDYTDRLKSNAQITKDTPKLLQMEIQPSLLPTLPVE